MSICCRMWPLHQCPSLLSIQCSCSRWTPPPPTPHCLYDVILLPSAWRSSRSFPSTVVYPVLFLLQVVPPFFTMSSFHLLLGGPLDLSRQLLSIQCCPSPGGSLVLYDVILPPSAWRSSGSFPSTVVYPMLSFSRWFPRSLRCHPSTFCLEVLWIFPLHCCLSSAVPAAGGCPLLYDVILPPSAWRSSGSFPSPGNFLSPGLPFHAPLGPFVVFHSRYVSSPFQFCFRMNCVISGIFVLFLISVHSPLSYSFRFNTFLTIAH